MKILLSLFLCLMVSSICCATGQFGKIENMSLTVLNENPVIFNGTCNECLCHMHINPSYSSFNCYRNNRTCRMHLSSNHYQLFRALSSSSSTFYYRSLPQCLSSIDCTSLSLTICDFMSSKLLNSFNNDSLFIFLNWIEGNIFVPGPDSFVWSFDSSLADQTSTLNFTWISNNSLTFSSSMIVTGSGQSLHLNSTMSEYIFMPSNSFPSLTNRSWTFELWLYLLTVPNVRNIGIIIQCESQTTNLCLHIVIRQQKTYFGFYGDDLSGSQTILKNQWYHLAFVFDHSTKTQSIYIDGFLDQSRQANQSFHGQLGVFYIGFPNHSSPLNTSSFLNGYIDQLQFSNRSKSSDEILNDATLTCYFSFDNQSLMDDGPLTLQVASVGSPTSFTTGRVGRALKILNNRTFHFQISNLVLIGMNNRSYSMSIWISPTFQLPSAIIHLSNHPDGIGTWCVSMLAIDTGGRLVTTSYNGSHCVATSGPIILPQRWTHVAFTYSLANGLRLYVNGTLFNSTSPFSYGSSNVKMYLTVGATGFNVSICCGNPSANNQYYGSLDEFRLYSRELTSDEVLCLANP